MMDSNRRRLLGFAGGAAALFASQIFAGLEDVGVAAKGGALSVLGEFKYLIPLNKGKHVYVYKYQPDMKKSI